MHLEIHHQRSLTLDDVEAVAAGKARVTLSDAPGFRGLIETNRSFLEEMIAKGADIYGVTTGFGDSSRHRLSHAEFPDLQRNLVNYHGCGVGSLLGESECAATLVIRLQNISRGRSGVSWELLEAMRNLLEGRIIPAIPSQGSVGASGDLTPLSYVAAALMGERQVYFRGQLWDAAPALAELGLAPYELKAKEALAIMNGTAVMSGVAALAWQESRRVALLASLLTGLVAELLEARTTPFLAALHDLKPHPGQREAARLIGTCLGDSPQRRARKADVATGTETHPWRLQDSYSIRCAPHVIGVLFDALSWTRGLLETEINAVTDNPVVMHETREFLNGGHFYGGHVAAACDLLKTSTANVVSLGDRQMAILLDSRLNGGLFPDNLSSRPGHHGFKALQISLSALAAEALKCSLPMSIFSRPTECQNQDVVSMGTIAARDFSNICAMARNAMAIVAMAAAQGAWLAKKQNRKLAPRSDKLAEALLSLWSPLETDRATDGDVARMAQTLFDEAFLAEFSNEESLT